VDQSDRTPKCPPAASASSLPQGHLSPRVSFVASAGFASVALNASRTSKKVDLARRNQTGPRLVPATGSQNSVSVIDDLRAKVRAIEQHPPVIGPALSDDAQSSCWTLGIPTLDKALGGGRSLSGLDCASVHEIKTSTTYGASDAAGWAAAIGFALRLAVRRSATASAPALVWCWPKALAREIGHLYGPGLEALGLDPSRMVFVETARARDALWAMEEALKSGAAGLVLGVLHDLNLLEARRLSLACQSAVTPCLLLTHASRPPAAATATRWRVGVHPSSPHPFVARLPGAQTVQMTIERCRLNPALPQSVPFALEWCDETHSFHMSSPLAHRTLGRGTGAPVPLISGGTFKVRGFAGGL